MDMTEKTLKKDYKFRGRIVNMRGDEALMPDGTTASREVVELSLIHILQGRQNPSGLP